MKESKTTLPKVSIIIPFYNPGKYFETSIESVFNQEYKNWELLLINDGSTDNSKEIALSFSDSRVKYYEQENKGVSAARNVGLGKMSGEFFCFLDADDQLTPNSLSSRLKVFEQDENIEFVDGKVLSLEKGNEIYKPEYTGNPLNDLISLSGKCFFGPTWMIRNTGKNYKFKEGLTHGEDLLFYISIAYSGLFQYTDKIVYKYRTQNQSAMSNLEGLERGYAIILGELKQIKGISKNQINVFHKKIRSIMFKSYLANLQVKEAIKVLLK